MGFHTLLTNFSSVLSFLGLPLLLLFLLEADTLAARAASHSVLGEDGVKTKMVRDYGKIVMHDSSHGHGMQLSCIKTVMVPVSFA